MTQPYEITLVLKILRDDLAADLIEAARHGAIAEQRGGDEGNSPEECLAGYVLDLVQHDPKTCAIIDNEHWRTEPTRAWPGDDEPPITSLSWEMVCTPEPEPETRGSFMVRISYADGSVETWPGVRMADVRRLVDLAVPSTAAMTTRRRMRHSLK